MDNGIVLEGLAFVASQAGPCKPRPLPTYLSFSLAPFLGSRAVVSRVAMVF